MFIDRNVRAGVPAGVGARRVQSAGGAAYPSLWAPLLYILAGQYEHAGVLGELVVQADRASVAQELGGDPARAMAAPKHTLQRKLVSGLRFLLKEELELNQPEASDGWLTDKALWLISKAVSNKLRGTCCPRASMAFPPPCQRAPGPRDRPRARAVAVPPNVKSLRMSCLMS